MQRDRLSAGGCAARDRRGVAAVVLEVVVAGVAVAVAVAVLTHSLERHIVLVDT